MGTISWGGGGGSRPSCAPTWPAVLGRGRTTQLGVATGLRSGSKSQGPDFHFVVKYVSHEMYHHSRVRTCNSVAVGTRHSVEHHFCVVKSFVISPRKTLEPEESLPVLPPTAPGHPLLPVSLGTGRPWTFQRRGSYRTGSFVLSRFHSARPFQGPSVLPAVSLLHPFLWLSNTPFYERGAHRILMQLTRWFRMKELFFFFFFWAKRPKLQKCFFFLNTVGARSLPSN